MTAMCNLYCAVQRGLSVCQLWLTRLLYTVRMRTSALLLYEHCVQQPSRRLSCIV